MHYVVFEQILILLALSVVVVAGFRRFHLPPILAYLAAGLLAGPHGLEWIPDSQDTRFLAEFGVVFLMFTVGLEFSIPQLLALRGAVLGMGGAQVLLTTAAAALVAWLLGLSPAAAIVVGGILALSSTALVTKQLNEQLEIHSRHGRNAIGILLFQDLAVIPFLIIIPILASGSEQSMAGPLLLALVKGAAAFTIMFAVGHWLLRPLFREIAAAHSAELFVLTVLLVALAAAWGTHLAGLSFALGAFLAGVMLGETEFRHQIEADIRPFRDVLLGLFFITIGMLLDLGELALIWPWVLLVLLGIWLVKGALIVLVCRVSGSDWGVAGRTALVLAQGGEFGFALLALAMGDNGLLPETAGQVVLASTVLSIAAAPFLIGGNGRIVKFLMGTRYLHTRSHQKEDIAHAGQGLQDHVIICGYGRVGQNVAQLLETEGFPYIALDLDPARISEAHGAGYPVFYGDATHSEILQAAGLKRARALLISYDDAASASKIMAQTRLVTPEIPILVRTRDETYLDHLQQEGATEVVPETLEASLMLSSRLLHILGVPKERVVKHVQAVRADRYQILRGYFHDELEHTGFEDEAGRRSHLHAVTVVEGAYAVGRSLRELDLEHCQVQVTAVRHGLQRTSQPEPDTELCTGDVLVLYGSPEDLQHAEARLLQG